MCVSTFSHALHSVTTWTGARQVSLPVGFPRQANWSGLSCLPSGDLPNQGIEPVSLICMYFTTMIVLSRGVT